MSGNRSAVPNLSLLELGIAIVCTRQAAPAHSQIADEIARWFQNDITACDVELPLQRLIARGDMAKDAGRFRTTDIGCARADEAARALVRLIFRDRFFFDVGRLLDVTLVREDSSRAQ